MKLLRSIFRIATLTIFSLVLSVQHAQAQVVPSGYEPGHSLWVGAEYSNVHASFPYGSSQRLQGAGALFDFHLTPRVGLLGDARFLNWGGFEGSTESSYLAGPRVFLFAKGKFRPYGKALVGAGRIHYPFAIGDASYLALAPGAGTEYRMSPRWMLRFDYEYQIWFNSPGYINEPDHRLTPNGFHIGVAYRLLR